MLCAVGRCYLRRVWHSLASLGQAALRCIKVGLFIQAFIMMPLSRSLRCLCSWSHHRPFAGPGSWRLPTTDPTWNVAPEPWIHWWRTPLWFALFLFVWDTIVSCWEKQFDLKNSFACVHAGNPSCSTLGVLKNTVGRNQKVINRFGDFSFILYFSLYNWIRVFFFLHKMELCNCVQYLVFWFYLSVFFMI